LVAGASEVVDEVREVETDIFAIHGEVPTEEAVDGEPAVLARMRG
jgi:hypothetical protein